MPDPSHQQWQCRVCGYIYDPRLHGGVAFEDQPADYRCPGCGYPKSVFRRRRPDAPIQVSLAAWAVGELPAPRLGP